MRAALDYSELDRWMADLDALHEELRSIRTKAVGPALPPMYSSANSKSTRLNERNHTSPENYDHTDGDRSFVSQTANVRNYIQPSRTDPIEVKLLQTHNPPSPAQQNYNRGLHVPKLIFATAIPSNSRVTSYQQFGAVIGRSNEQVHQVAKEPKYVHWSNDIETRTPWESSVNILRNHISKSGIPEKTIGEAKLQSVHTPVSVGSKTHYERNTVNSIRNSHRITPKTSIREFAMPVNLADYTMCENLVQFSGKLNAPIKKSQSFGATVNDSSSFETIRKQNRKIERSYSNDIRPRESNRSQCIVLPTVTTPSNLESVPNGVGQNRVKTSVFLDWRPEPMADARIITKGKLILRVYQPDKTTKAIAIESHTTAFEVIQIMLAKNLMKCSTKHALVEKIPCMKLERCFEDSEPLMDCLINWNFGSENLIFFEEREDMFGMFENPTIWLGEEITLPKRKLNKHDIKQIFLSNKELNLPAHSGHLYVRAKEKKWKRWFCLLRNSGLYISQHNSKDISAFQRLVTFKPYLHLYTTTGGWKKLNAPTPFGFTIRAFSSQPTDTLCTIHFCASSEETLRIWCSLLRLALAGPSILEDYTNRIEYIAKHAVNKRASVGVIGLERSFVNNEMSNERATRADSFNRCQLKAKSETRMPSIEGNLSSNELGCVTGRPDVRRSLRSVSAPEDTENQRYSFRNTSSISSLFMCGSSSAREEHEKQNLQRSPEACKSKSPERHKRSLYRSGPAARRCSRSVSQISAPFNTVVPNQVNQRSTPLHTDVNRMKYSQQNSYPH